MNQSESLDDYSLPKWCLMAPLAVALIVYGQSLGFEFQDWDDRVYLLENPVFQLGLVDALKMILTPGAMPEESLYIPVAYLTFLFDSIVWGFNSAVAHGINTLLHGLNGVLIMAILTKLLKHPVAALIGAMIFVLHPLQAESVAWAFSRRELLAGGFALGAILAYLKHAEAPSRMQYALSLALFGLGLLCKPNAFLVFLALPVLARGMTGEWGKRRLLEVVPYAAMSALCVVVNATVEEGSRLSLRAQLHQLNFLPFMVTEWIGRILCFMRPFPYYLRTELTAEVIAWQYLIVPGALVFGAYLIVRLKAWSLAGYVLFALLALAPAGAIVLQANRYFYTADRYVYLAMLGVAGVAAMVCSRLKLPKKKLLAAMAPVLALLAVLCFLQVRVWRDSTMMNTYALLRDRGNPIALSFLATAAYENEDDADARQFVNAALQVDPSHAAANRLRVMIARRTSDPNEQRYFYRYQLAKYGWDYVAYVRASEMDAKGDEASALGLLNLVASSQPDRDACPDVYFLKAKIHGRNRRVDDALQCYRLGLGLVPERTAAWFNLGMTAMQNGRWPTAVESFREVLKRTPEDMEATLYLGVALMNTGSLDEAIERLKQVKERLPRHPAPYAALIDAYTRSGDSANAKATADAASENGVVLPND